MNPLTRRTFLKTSALVSAATAFSARSWSQVAGANGDIRVAVVGLNGRGKSHLNSLSEIAGVRLVALCDVDTAVIEKTKANLGKAAAAVKTYVDLREMLASPDIDAVTIATPNHTHSLLAIWAMQAGKDVYVEKPVSHNIWEGRQLVSAAAKYNRVVQCGTQVRSGAGLQEAVAWVKAGNLGKVTASRGFCYKRRDSIGKTEGPQKIPSTVNYDLWCGPAPKTDLFRKKLHYDWHWLHVTGNGDVGNQGIHQMDVARWFLGETGLPRQTLSIGGRIGYIDDGDTPNTQVVIHDYPSAPLIFEVRGLPAKPGAAAAGGEDDGNARRSGMDNYHGVGIGNVVDCEGGSVVVPSYFAATAFDKAGKVVKAFEGSDRHMQNFIDVVRSRKIANLYGRIEEGHLSSALCHLGNISHVLGQAAAPDALREKIKGNKPLAEAHGRMVEHLAVHRIDLAKAPLTLGVPLTIAPGKEKFTGEFAKTANPLLTRQYRAPFVVPDLTSAT
ncbi:MAG: twin-arginine translocation signal domain-containing protein [Opitutus sp.]|nr:twin-arginine translocation signal domain-containing protein [Opitutus sp.]